MSAGEGAHSNSRSLLSMLMALLLVSAAVSLCVLVKNPNTVPWYTELKIPWFVPSNTVFGSVWTALYLLMAYGFGRILSLPPGAWRQRIAIMAFLAQLALNVLWSFLFFGAHSPQLGLIDIVVQGAFIVVTIIAFWPLDWQAALALVPVAAWVAYMGLLNFEIWRLN